MQKPAQNYNNSKSKVKNWYETNKYNKTIQDKITILYWSNRKGIIYIQTNKSMWIMYQKISKFNY